jgi:predicted MFS family arabinose efflux permease
MRAGPEGAHAVPPDGNLSFWREFFLLVFAGEDGRQIADLAVAAGDTVDGRTGARAISPTTTLVILTLVYVVNYLDRQILGILNGPIKAEFHVTNTQIGLLNGPAFALIYATLGIPIAAFADRVNRRNVIAGTMMLFSVMTILCGYAQTFWQLLLARFGTGIGEAGTSPSVASILADLYPRARRAAALSFYSAGLNVGLLLGFFGGGWIAELYGWRNAFLAAGLPGLALAVILMVCVREPARGHVERLEDRERAPGFAEVLAWLRSQRSFGWMAVGTSLSSFGGYAAIAFVPLFLRESHHMSLHAIGLVLAIFTGSFGALGTWLAGVLSDRFGRRDVRWNMYVPMLAWVFSAPFVPIFLLASNLYISLAAGIAPAFVGAVYVGPAQAMAQALVPLRMRVRTSAVLLFILNIFGLGVSAPVVGKISDLLQPALGPDALRYALMINLLTGFLGVLCYWRASRTLPQDLARAQSREGKPDP